MIDQPIEEAKLDLFEVQFQKNGEKYCVMLLRGDFSKWISVLRFDGFEWVEFEPNHLESDWISDKLRLMGY